MKTETPNYDHINPIEIKNLFSKADLDKTACFLIMNHFSAMIEGVKLTQSHEHIQSKMEGIVVFQAVLYQCV